MAMLYNNISSLHPTFTIHRRNAISKRILDNAFEDVVLLQAVKLEANPRECVSINELINSESAVIPIAFPNAFARNQFIECIRTSRADHAVIFIKISKLMELIRKHEKTATSPGVYVRRIIAELASAKDSGKFAVQFKRGIQLVVNFESDLENLKRLAEFSLVSRKHAKMWVFAYPNEIHNVEEIMQVSGYELLKIRQEQIIQQIIECSVGEDKISSEVASRLLSEYENKVLSAIPTTSNAIIGVMNICHLSPPENPILYSFLLAKIFKGDDISSNVKSLTQMCADFVERHVGLSNFASVIANSCYSDFAGILRDSILDFRDDDDIILECGGVSDQDHLGVIANQGASYLLALLLVDQQYEPHLNRETATSFIQQVFLAVERRNGIIFPKHESLWYFVNSLLEERDDNDGKYFLSVMRSFTVDSRDRSKFIKACVAGNYLNLLKQMRPGPADLDVIGTAVQLADKETLAFIFKQIKLRGRDLMNVYTKSRAVAGALIELAVTRGNYAITEYLLERLAFSGNTSRPLLHQCVAESRYDDNRVIQDKCQIIQRLVTLDPSLLNRKSVPGGYVPLCYLDIHMDLLKLLVGPLGANLADERWSALHSVAEYLGPEEYHEFVEFLVATNNADVFHARDADGNTVLHKALLNLDVLPETIRIFKSHRLDFNAISNGGSPLLLYAIQKHRSALIINTLIECGANFEGKINGRYYLLHAAASSRNVAAIRILVQRGVHVNMPTSAKVKFIPLHYACFATSSSSSNLLETVRTLVDCGADVNAKSWQGRTCLHFAVIRSEAPDLLASLRYLICRGARVDAKDKYGKTMLDYALARSPRECEKIAQLTLKKNMVINKK